MGLTELTMDLAASTDCRVEATELFGVERLSEQRLNVLRDLLDHSFYRRWVEGGLSIHELQGYACQYAHVVGHLPRWLRRTASCSGAYASSLGAHATEEEAHVRLWAEFASATGVSESELTSARPNRATAELLRLGDELSAQPTGVAVAWALEVQTPAVSAEKLKGLSAHFGIDDKNGGGYFQVHASRDLVHADELNTAIADLSEDQLRVAQLAADQITCGLWDLLSSVEHAA